MFLEGVCMDLFFVWLFLIAQIVIAVVYTFWGYRYFKVIIAFYAFIFVFPFMSSLLAGSGSMDETTVTLISLLVAGVAALLAWFFFRLGIFLAGGFAGLAIARLIYGAMGSDSVALSVILSIILFILLGILALKFQKAIIIFVSSFVGAFTLVTYGLFVFTKTSMIPSFSIMQMGQISNTVSGTFQAAWLVPSIIIAIVGILVQALLTAKGRNY
jgi:hypothetical protein